MHCERCSDARLCLPQKLGSRQRRKLKPTSNSGTQAVPQALPQTVLCCAVLAQLHTGWTGDRLFKVSHSKEVACTAHHARLGGLSAVQTRLRSCTRSPAQQSGWGSGQQAGGVRPASRRGQASRQGGQANRLGGSGQQAGGSRPAGGGEGGGGGSYQQAVWSWLSRQGLQVTRAGGFVSAGGGSGQEARGGQVRGKRGVGGEVGEILWQELLSLAVVCVVGLQRIQLVRTIQHLQRKQILLVQHHKACSACLS